MSDEKKPDRIYIDDCRKAGHCVAGVKEWAQQMGVDFRDFMHNGIAIEDVAAKGDAFGHQVIKSTTVRRGK